MQMLLRNISLAFLFLVLSGCATTISTQIALPEDMRGAFRIDSVRVTSIAGIEADISSRLKSAIEAEVFRADAGGTPLSISAEIQGFYVVSAVSRFFAGAIAGSSTMDVHVIVQREDGDIVAEYDVNRKANPGGYGAFTDQEQALISQAAKGVAEGLFGAQ